MREKGFTLIELLAVIVILAIILAIAIPSISAVINKSTASAFESDAKLVLKAAEYKVLEDTSFDPTTINKDNINNLLGLSNQNYNNISIVKKNNIYQIIIIGMAKWNGLIACGTFKNMKVVGNASDCNCNMIPPVITLLGGNSITIYVGDAYTDPGATASDDIDGDITSNIQVTSNLNSTIPGTYTITYNVVDSSGNAASPVTREVIVQGLDPRYNAIKGVNSPALATGMTPIKWDGTAWVDTTTDDIDWYNYDTTNKQWANAKTADGSMWVWIPRFIYKIPTANWHKATASTIDIQFSKGANDNWNKAVIGNINTDTTANASNGTWTNHPAFTFGNTEVIGIWVAKFEASGTTANVNFVPNVASLRTQTIGTFFTAARNIETNSLYGWGTSGDGIDTHMMKNTEWGSVTYLAQSLYGKNSEVWTNPSQSFITGCAGNSATAATVGCPNTYNTTNGMQASTTGTIYGIYDMSAGAWEYMAAYIDNGNTVLNTNGSVIIASDAKYKDIYTKASTDSSANNYAIGINKKGDAIYEISTTGTGTTSWYSDNSLMPSTTVPFFLRSGSYNLGAPGGIFSFYNIEGAANSNRSFRTTLLVDTGL
jgi:prepilin-type N-terminal cleavage/methylation domain-containing protein